MKSTIVKILSLKSIKLVCILLLNIYLGNANAMTCIANDCLKDILHQQLKDKNNPELLKYFEDGGEDVVKAWQVLHKHPELALDTEHLELLKKVHTKFSYNDNSANSYAALLKLTKDFDQQKLTQFLTILKKVNDWFGELPEFSMVYNKGLNKIEIFCPTLQNKYFSRLDIGDFSFQPHRDKIDFFTPDRVDVLGKVGDYEVRKLKDKHLFDFTKAARIAGIEKFDNYPDFQDLLSGFPDKGRLFLDDFADITDIARIAETSNFLPAWRALSKSNFTDANEAAKIIDEVEWVANHMTDTGKSIENVMDEIKNAGSADNYTLWKNNILNPLVDQGLVVTKSGNIFGIDGLELQATYTPSNKSLQFANTADDLDAYQKIIDKVLEEGEIAIIDISLNSPSLQRMSVLVESNRGLTEAALQTPLGEMAQKYNLNNVSLTTAPNDQLKALPLRFSINPQNVSDLTDAYSKYVLEYLVLTGRSHYYTLIRKVFIGDEISDIANLVRIANDPDEYVHFFNACEVHKELAGISKLEEVTADDVTLVARYLEDKKQNVDELLGEISDSGGFPQWKQNVLNTEFTAFQNRIPEDLLPAYNELSDTEKLKLSQELGVIDKSEDGSDTIFRNMLREILENPDASCLLR